MLDFRSNAFRRDPHAVYRRLRDRHRVYWEAKFKAWVVLGYREVTAAFKNPGLVSGWVVEPPPGTGLAGLRRTLSREILYADPPRHAVVRRVLSEAFSAAAVERLRPAARRLARSLIARVRSAGAMEVVQDFALPLSFALACESLGFPGRDRRKIGAWTGAIRDLTILGGAARAEAAVAGHDRFRAYVLSAVARRRRSPGTDGLSLMIAADPPRGGLTDDEWVANALMVLQAGSQNPANLIGNLLQHLLRRPRDRACLSRDPGTLGPLIDEQLRHESPVHLAARRACSDLRLGGERVREGDLVLLMLASANRDAHAFPAPGRFSVSRRGRGHVAFGHGAHYCLGHGLARMQAEVALEALLALDDLRLADREPTWSDTPTLRGPKTLRIRFRRRR